MAKNGMRPIHPGEVLREEYLLPLGMSANALAKALRVAAPRINLQAACDLRVAERRNAKRVAREVVSAA